jgi:hypothetical protein
MTDLGIERPTDRALHALAEHYRGCSAYAGGNHRPPCPGADGHDHNLPHDEHQESARA